MEYLSHLERLDREGKWDVSENGVQKRFFECLHCGKPREYLTSYDYWFCNGTCRRDWVKYCRDHPQLQIPKNVEV